MRVLEYIACSSPLLKFLRRNGGGGRVSRCSSDVLSFAVLLENFKQKRGVEAFTGKGVNWLPILAKMAAKSHFSSTEWLLVYIYLSTK